MLKVVPLFVHRTAPKNTSSKFTSIRIPPQEYLFFNICATTFMIRTIESVLRILYFRNRNF